MKLNAMLKHYKKMLCFLIIATLYIGNNNLLNCISSFKFTSEKTINTINKSYLTENSSYEIATIASNENVNYYNPTDKTTKVQNAIVLENGVTSLTSGWYVVKGTIEVNERLVISGNVTIILADGALLNATQGISVEDGNALTIYGQSADYENNGKIVAIGFNGWAGIGSGSSIHSGPITINGGNIYASGAYADGAGIGGGKEGNGTVTINGGYIYAEGSYLASGIGGGNAGDGTVKITGGIITAFGGIWSGSGIGGGCDGDGNVTITGGKIEAYGEDLGAGIGGGQGSAGNVTITGGKVKAKGGNRCLADIGDGNNDAGTPPPVPGKFSTGPDGNAIIVGSVLDKSNKSEWKGIVESTVYGDYTLDHDYTMEGSFTIPDGSSLTVPENVTLTNNGEITNEGGFHNNGTFRNNVTFDNNGIIENNGNFVNNGNLENNKTFNNEKEFTNSDRGQIENRKAFNNRGNVTNDGVFRNLDNGDIQNDRTFHNNDLFDNEGNIENNGNIINSSNGTIRNNDTITNDGEIDNNGNITNSHNGNIQNNDTLNNNRTLMNDGNITNDGNLSNNKNGKIQNNNTLTNNNKFANDGKVTNDGNLTNKGTLTNSDNGSIQNNNTLNNDRNLTNDGNIINDGNLNNNEDGKIQNNDTLTNNKNFTNDGKVTNDGNLTNKGTLTNSNNGSIQNNDTLNNDGKLTNNGNITNSEDGIIQNNDTLNNNGKLTNDGNIKNDGTLTNSENGKVQNNNTLTNSKDVTNNGKITNDGSIENTEGSNFKNQEKGIIENNKDFVNDPGSNYESKGVVQNKKYSVKFISSDGSKISEINVSYGELLKRPNYMRKGYTLIGWYLDKEFSKEWNFESDFMPSHDIVLYARWKINSYKVSFKSVDNVKLPNDMIKEYNTVIKLPKAPIKPGYTGEWVVDGKTVTEIKVTDNITVNLIYTINRYTVNFVDDGRVVMNTYVNYGQKIKDPNISKQGYDLDGWYLEKDYINKWDFNTNTIGLGNVTLFAKWMKKEEGNLQEDIESSSDVNAKLSMSQSEIADAVLTDEDRELLENGYNIKIILDISDAQVSSKNKSILMEKAKGYTLYQYFDIELLKLIENNKENIITTLKPLKITIDIPSDVQNKDREFILLRLHDGDVSILKDLDDNDTTYTFESDKFSIYALAYKEKKEDSKYNFIGLLILFLLICSIIVAIIIYNQRRNKEN